MALFQIVMNFVCCSCHLCLFSSLAELLFCWSLLFCSLLELVVLSCWDCLAVSLMSCYSAFIWNFAFSTLYTVKHIRSDCDLAYHIFMCAAVDSCCSVASSWSVSRANICRLRVFFVIFILLLLSCCDLSFGVSVTLVLFDFVVSVTLSFRASFYLWCVCHRRAGHVFWSGSHLVLVL